MQVVSSTLLLLSSASASAHGWAPQLQVTWNETDGNMSLSYGNLKVLGGPPTEYDTPAHGVWDPGTNTYTQRSPKAPMNWTIRYSVDADKAELQLSVTVQNGPEYSEHGLTLWPINGKNGKYLYPAKLTEPEFTGYCDPKVNMQKPFHYDIHCTRCSKILTEDLMNANFL